MESGPPNQFVCSLSVLLPHCFLKQPELLKRLRPTSEVFSTSQKEGPLHSEEYEGTYPQAQPELEKTLLL